MIFKTLYYGFGLLLAVVEFSQLKNVINVSEKMRDYIDFLKMKKNNSEEVKWNEIPADVKPVILSKVILTVIELFWLALGIFTFNWAFFASYMIYIWLTGTLSGGRPSPTFYSLRSITFIVFVLFVLINSYHLKIDFFSLF